MRLAQKVVCSAGTFGSLTQANAGSEEGLSVIALIVFLVLVLVVVCLFDDPRCF